VTTLGIDIGGSKLGFVLGDTEGRPVARHRCETRASGDPERDLRRIVGGARELLRRSGLEARALAQVGVSCPGPLDAEQGVVQGPPNLPGWDAVPLRSRLEAAFGCPVRIENDANAAALAEWRHGAGRGFAHLVFLTMSTGVGAGLVLGGRLYRGRAALAGEVGHVPVEWQGEACVCGRRGCLEAYVGGAAWSRRLRDLTPESSAVAALAGTRARIEPRHVVEAARASGDTFACAELARWNEYLARAIVQLVFTLAPEVVVLGTIAAAAGEALCLEPLRERVRAQLWPRLAEGLEIRAAELGDTLPDYAALAAAGRGPGEGAG